MLCELMRTCRTLPRVDGLQIRKPRYGLGDPDMEAVAKARTELEPVLDVLAKRLSEVSGRYVQRPTGPRERDAAP